MKKALMDSKVYFQFQNTENDGRVKDLFWLGAELLRVGELTHGKYSHVSLHNDNQ